MPKIKVKKEKLDQLDFIKVNFYATKDVIKKVEKATRGIGDICKPHKW